MKRKRKREKKESRPGTYASLCNREINKFISFAMSHSHNAAETPRSLYRNSIRNNVHSWKPKQNMYFTVNLKTTSCLQAFQQKKGKNVQTYRTGSETLKNEKYIFAVGPQQRTDIRRICLRKCMSVWMVADLFRELSGICPEELVQRLRDRDCH